MIKFDFSNKKSRSLIKRISKSEVFELGKPTKVENPLSLFGGLYTIKRIDIDHAELFTINDKNLIAGYVHADKGATTLDLTSDTPKLILMCVGSFYHFFLDDVSNIIEAMEQYPDYEVIIDISRVDMLMGQEDSSFTFFYEFIELFKTYNLKHKVVKLTDFDIIYINDFYKVDYKDVSSLKAENIYEFFGPYVKNPEQKPFRSVYVSRRRQDEAIRPHMVVDPESNFVYDGLRVDSELAIEKIFLDLGYEIVYPEDFDTFADQVDFFHSVKTIVSLTSSGLTNAVFMPPGGTLIELVSPIIARPITPGSEIGELQKAIHNYYKDIAFLKDHTYLAIQNPNFKSADIIDAIESNKKVKDFLRVVNE